VFAGGGAKVTVAKAEEGKPQTISKENTAGSPARAGSIGIPQEKIETQ